MRKFLFLTIALCFSSFIAASTPYEPDDDIKAHLVAVQTVDYNRARELALRLEAYFARQGNLRAYYYWVETILLPHRQNLHVAEAHRDYEIAMQEAYWLYQHYRYYAHELYNDEFVQFYRRRYLAFRRLFEQERPPEPERPTFLQNLYGGLAAMCAGDRGR